MASKRKNYRVSRKLQKAAASVDSPYQNLFKHGRPEMKWVRANPHATDFYLGWRIPDADYAMLQLAGPPLETSGQLDVDKRVWYNRPDNAYFLYISKTVPQHWDTTAYKWHLVMAESSTPNYTKENRK